MGKYQSPGIGYFYYLQQPGFVFSYPETFATLSYAFLCSTVSPFERLVPISCIFWMCKTTGSIFLKPVDLNLCSLEPIAGSTPASGVELRIAAATSCRASNSAHGCWAPHSWVEQAEQLLPMLTPGRPLCRPGRRYRLPLRRGRRS